MRNELSFDGNGINGPDQYRTRIATFSMSASDADVRRYGKLFEAAPNMLAAEMHPDLAAEISRALIGDTAAEFADWLTAHRMAHEATGRKLPEPDDEPEYNDDVTAHESHDENGPIAP